MQNLQSLEEYGMFILVILSHGKLHNIYGADDQPVPYLRIMNMLSNENFAAMRNKPKLLLFEACATGEMVG